MRGARAGGSWAGRAWRALALAALVVMPLGGCDWLALRALHIEDAEKLVFARPGEHWPVNACEVRRQEGLNPKTIWLVYSDRILVRKGFRVQYGVVPQGFAQLYPLNGAAPEPLREGQKYVISAKELYAPVPGATGPEGYPRLALAGAPNFKVLWLPFVIKGGSAVLDERDAAWKRTRKD